MKKVSDFIEIDRKSHLGYVEYDHLVKYNGMYINYKHESMVNRR